MNLRFRKKLFITLGGMLPLSIGLRARLSWSSMQVSSNGKLTVMTKQDKEAACLTAYNEAIDNLDPMYFCANAIKFFRHSFKKKDEPMTAYPLYRYYSDSREKCALL
jgi:hypothetical protein